MVNFNTGGIERALITIFFYAASFVYCLRVNVDKSLLQKNLNFIYFLCTSFLIFSIYAMFSILIGRDPYTVLVYVFPLLSFCYLSLFTFLIVDTEKVTKYLDFISIWAFSMCVFVAYVTYLTYTTDFSFAYNIAVSGTESDTSLDDVVGNRIPDLFLPIYLSIGLGLVFASRSITRRLLGLFIVLLSSFLIVISFWRTAQLSAIFSIFIFLLYLIFFSENKVKNLRYIFISFVLLSPFVAFILSLEIIEGFSTYSLLESRLTDLFTGRSESGSFRLLSIIANLDLSIDYWLFGLGFGKIAVTNNQDLIILGSSSNYFVDLIVWFGIPLSLTFIVFLLRFIFLTIFYLEKKGVHRRFSIIFILIILNSFIILCFFPSVVSYPVLETIALFMGTGAKMVYELKKETK